MSEARPRKSKLSDSADWLVGSYVGILGFGIALWNLERMVVDQAGPPWPFAGLGVQDTGLVLSVAAGIMMVNAVLFDLMMAVEAHRPRKVRAGVRQLRFLLASLPFAGSYAMAAWGWMVERRPRWAFRPERLAPGAGGLWRRLLIWRRSQLRSHWRWGVAVFPLLWLLNILLLQAVGVWLAALWLEGARWALILAHGTLFAMSAGYLVIQRRSLRYQPWRAAVSWLLAFSWLAPVPFCAAGFLITVAAEGSAPSSLLTTGAFLGRRTLTRVPSKSGRGAGTAYSRLLRPVRGMCSFAPPFVVERRLLLERLKTGLLALDAMALAWVAISLGRRIPVLELPIKSLVALMIFAAAGLAAAAAMALAVHPLARRSMPASWLAAATSPSVAGTLASTQLILALGFLLGLQLGLGRLADAGAILLFSGGLGAVFIGAWAFLGNVKAQPWRFGWVLSSAVAAALGWGLLWLPETAPLAIVMLAAAAFLAPLAEVGAGWALAGWLIRPFTAGEISDARCPQRVRWLLALLLASAVSPFGGLLVPVWRFTRDRWWPRLERQLLPAAIAVSSPRPSIRDTSEAAGAAGGRSPRRCAEIRAHRESYAFRYWVTHLGNARKYDQLWTLLETKPFLVDQARYFRGFEQSSDDLERVVIPATVREQNWYRFARFSAIALSFGRLAGELTDDGVLDTIAGHGQIDLAIDVASRIDDVGRRLRAWGVLGRRLAGTDRLYKTVADRACQDLNALSKPSEETSVAALLLPLAEAFVDLEAVMLALLADPELRELREKVRFATALGCLRRSSDGVLDADFWDRLGKIRSTTVLLESLPEVLLDESDAGSDPQAISERVAALPAADENLLWHCRAAVLGCKAQQDPDEARRCWQRWTAGQAWTFSGRMAVLAAGLFRRWSLGELETWIIGLDNAQLRALLWFVVLQGVATGERPDDDFRALAAHTRIAIDELPPNRRLAGLTDYLEALDGRPVVGRDDDLRRVRRIIRGARFALPAEFLARYLVLLAELRPKILQSELMDAVLDSGSGQELLLNLAQRPKPRALLDLLVERSESHIPALRLDVTTSIEVGQRILRRATAGLCVLRHDLRALERVLPRAQDRDGLRVAVVEALAANDQFELAATVVEGIRSRRRRLTTRLRALPKTVSGGGELTPDSLYTALATTEAIDDELAGLNFFHAPPRAMETLARVYLETIRRPKHRIAALIRRLVRDRRAEVVLDRREQRVALDLLEQALADVDDDRFLVGLTPLLPGFAVPLGFSRVAEELEDAFRRLLAFRSVPWPERRRALEDLMSSMVTLPLGRTGRVAALLRALAVRLTADEETDSEPRVNELLPILVATAERFPPQVLRCLGHSRGRDRARGGWLPIHAGAGVDPFQGPVGMRIRALCAAGDAERQAFEAHVRQSTDPDPRIVETLIYLSSGQRPEAAAELVEILLSGRKRDDLCLRLIRHGWLSGGEAHRVFEHIEAPETRLEAELWLGEPQTDGPDWYVSLAKLVAQRDIDPDDPRHRRWLQAVRAASQGHVSLFADATLEALRQGGWERAELALRFWLHAALGSKKSYRQNAQAIAEGLRSSLSLEVPSRG